MTSSQRDLHPQVCAHAGRTKKKAAEKRLGLERCEAGSRERPPAPWLGVRELSIFIRRGFSIGDDDLEYPDIGVRAVLHLPSSRSAESAGSHAGLGSAALIRIPSDDEVMPLVLIAPQPVLIQNEPSYADAVEADGHSFLFQINEEGWPVVAESHPDFVEEYLFGYGSVYFYGSSDATGLVREVVPGFLDF